MPCCGLGKKMECQKRVYDQSELITRIGQIEINVDVIGDQVVRFIDNPSVIQLKTRDISHVAVYLWPHVSFRTSWIGKAWGSTQAEKPRENFPGDNPITE